MIRTNRLEVRISKLIKEKLDIYQNCYNPFEHPQAHKSDQQGHGHGHGGLCM